MVTIETSSITLEKDVFLLRWIGVVRSEVSFVNGQLKHEQGTACDMDTKQFTNQGYRDQVQSKD